MVIAESISSHTTVLPRRFSIISLYFLSVVTRSEAILTKPKQSSKSFSSRLRGLIAVSGKNVARPPRVSLRYAIARFASFSLSTITFCNAIPRAVSTATEYLSLTLISCESGPWIPFNAPRLLSFITLRTEP